MKNLIKSIFSCLVAGLFILIALGSITAKSVYYNVNLNSVERPVNVKEQFGETTVVYFSDLVEPQNSYEDDYIAISWYVDDRQFNFELLNKSNHTIMINWDDISYVDYNGRTIRVMHAGVKYIDKNASQPSTMLPKGAILSDVLIPTNNIKYNDGMFVGWSEGKLIPSLYEDKKEIESLTSQYIGKTLTILMPLYIKNVQNDYIFTFSIDSYELPKKNKILSSKL